MPNALLQSVERIEEFGIPDDWAPLVSRRYIEDSVKLARFVSALAARVTDADRRAADRVSRVIGGEWIVKVYCPKKDDEDWSKEAPFVAGRLYDADLLMLAKQVALPIIDQLREGTDE